MRKDVAALAVLTCLLPLSASAADPVPVDEVGEQIRPTMPENWEEYAQTLSTEPPASRQGDIENKLVWVNFDGGRANSSIYSGTVNPFAEDRGLRASIIQSLRKRSEAYDIRYVWSQPQSGDYDIEFVGEWADRDSGGAAGIAPAGDCWDAAGGQTSFTMLGGGTSDGVAEVILQEIAHTWGLDHVDEQQDLLFPTTQGSNKTFKDECFTIVRDTDLNPGGSRNCSHHSMACGTTAQQNSHQELMMIFGPAKADTTPPQVVIISPEDGAVVETNSEVVIGVADQLEPSLIKTTITVFTSDGGELGSQTDNYVGPSEYTFPLQGLPDGTYDVEVEGIDEGGNPTTDAITIHVNQEGPTEPPDSGGGDGDGDGGDGDGDSGGGDGDGGDPGAMGGEDEKGCACATGPAPTGAGLTILLVGTTLARRRRRA